MTPKSKNILVGIFVVVLSAGTIIFTTWLGSTAVQEETDTYLAYLDESVSGLSQNSPVKYKGVTIGQVEKIRINPENSNQVELQMIIKRGTPIKTDSELVLTSQGITGLQYIEISGGSEDKDFLKAKPGDRYPVIPSGKSTLATVEAAIGPMLQNINLTIGDIREILKSANPERLSHIFEDVESITGTVAKNSETLIENINQTSTGLKQTVDQTNQLVSNANQFFEDRQGQITALLNRFETTTGSVNRLLTAIEQEKLIGSVKNTLGTANRFLDTLQGDGAGSVKTVVEDVNRATAKLNQLLDQLEQAKIIQGAAKTVSDLDRLVINLESKIDGPMNTLLEDARQSVVAANRLVTRIEQEQIVEGVGSTLDKVDQIVGDFGATAKNADQFVASLNQTAQRTDQFVENLDRTADNVNQFVENLNQTSAKTDEFVSGLNATTDNVNQFIDNLDQTASNANQFITNLNRTAGNVDQFVANLNETTDGVDAFMKNLVQTAEKTDQFVSNLSKTADNVDQFVLNLNQTAGKTDQFVSNLSKTTDNVDQFVANLNQTAGKADLLRR